MIGTGMMQAALGKPPVQSLIFGIAGQTPIGVEQLCGMESTVVIQRIDMEVCI